MRTRTWLAVIKVVVLAFVIMPWTSASGAGKGKPKVPSNASGSLSDHPREEAKTRRIRQLVGSRPAIAITAVIVTTMVVAGGLAGALPGTRSVFTDDINTGAVTSRTIKNNNVKSKDIKNETIQSKDIRDETVQSDDIRDETIHSRDIKNETIQSNDIRDETMRSEDIKDQTIRSRDIRDGTITTADLSSDAIPDAFKVPSGAVMFFDLSACPKGWRMFTDAQGRTVVGGTPDTTVGAALADGEDRTHQHSWADYEYEQIPEGGDWYSYNNAGERINIVDWADGIDVEGQHFYPLGIFSPDRGSESFYTNEASTSGVMPYVQLLPCVKK